MIIIDKRGKIIFLWEKFRRFLVFFSYLFGIGLMIRRFAYACRIKKKAKLNTCLISIGNITLGGTGKTPLVEYVARKFQKNNKKVCVLSRGYRGADEAILFSKRNKDILILTGKNREQNGREAIDKFGVEVILLDDGFQHWPLERDLDIVTLDSTRPIWKERLLPAGTLREKACSLKRAHVFVLTRVGLSESEGHINAWLEYLKDINPRAPVFLTRHTPEKFINRTGESFSLEFIKDREIIAFSGIAAPEAFEETLKTIGGKLRYAIRYSDHHRYTSGDLEEIARLAENGASIITTEKDLVRINDARLDSCLLALVVEIEFLKDADKFLEKIFA